MEWKCRTESAAKALAAQIIRGSMIETVAMKHGLLESVPLASYAELARVNLLVGFVIHPEAPIL